MLNIIYLSQGDLSTGDVLSLAHQGVETNECDYILLVPVSQLEKQIDYDNSETYYPKNGTIDDMLGIYTKNSWHIADFRGETYGIGVAYRA